MIFKRKYPSWACLSIPIFGVLLSAMPAHASLHLDFAPALGGTTANAVFDTSTNLQWLTPQTTKGLSFAGVASSGYFTLGYRYATSSELIALLDSSGYETAPLLADPRGGHWVVGSSDKFAVNSLISLLGATAGTTIIYGMLADIILGGAISSQGHSLASLSEQYILVLGPAFPTSDFDTGSFLVRQLAPIPETGTAAMFTIGLLLLGRRFFSRMPKATKLHQTPME